MNLVSVRLTHDYVLVRRIPFPTSTKGGIHLPTNSTEVPQLAHIVLIGPKNPDKLYPGMMVLLSKFAGHQMFFDEGNFHLLHVEDLLAVVER